jgi:hypothetical protein
MKVLETGDGDVSDKAIPKTTPRYFVPLTSAGTIFSSSIVDDNDYPNPSVPGGLRTFLLGDVPDDPAT